VRPIDSNSASGPWLRKVLTDIQFWVPLVVLMGGLALLRLIH
jgi:hypothetical protein